MIEAQRIIQQKSQDVINIFELIPNPQISIAGENCILKPLKRSDIKTIKKWFSDRDLISRAFGILAEDQVIDHVARDYLKDIFLCSSELFGIWQDENDLIGFVNYAVKRFKEYTAKIGILIGKPDLRNRGLGTEAMNLTLLYLFDRLSIERVELDTAYFNSPAHRCFEKCGFIIEGESTAINLINGELIHKKIMSIDRERFFSDLYTRFDKFPVFEGDIPPSKYISKIKFGKNREK